MQISIQLHACSVHLHVFLSLSTLRWGMIVVLALPWSNVCCDVAGFVSCMLEGPSLRCEFYGITQSRPVFSIQVYA